MVYKEITEADLSKVNERTVIEEARRAYDQEERRKRNAGLRLWQGYALPAASVQMTMNSRASPHAAHS